MDGYKSNINYSDRSFINKEDKIAGVQYPKKTREHSSLGKMKIMKTEYFINYSLLLYFIWYAYQSLAGIFSTIRIEEL